MRQIPTHMYLYSVYSSVPGPPFLTSDDVALCPINPEDETDVATVQASINDPNTRRLMGLTTPYSELGEQEWLRSTDERDDHLLLFVVDRTTEEPVGNVELLDITHPHGHAEIGCWIYSDYREQGYATAACELLLKYAFTELRLHRVGAVALDSNSGSKRLLQSLGFVHEGTSREYAYVDGEYVDLHRYSLLATEWD